MKTDNEYPTETILSRRKRYRSTGAQSGRAQPKPASHDSAMVSTKDVVNHHLKCFGDRDLEGVLSDYAPGAVLLMPNAVLKGVEAIRPLFEAARLLPNARYKNVMQLATVQWGFRWQKL